MQDRTKEEPILPFKILLKFTNAISQSALIDSGAECNVMPYATWTLLGCPKLTPTSISFVSFAGTKTPSVGKLSVNVKIENTTLPNEFS